MPRFDTRASQIAYRIVATVVLVSSGIGLSLLARDSELLHEALAAAGLSLVALGKFIVLGGFDTSSQLGPFGLALLAFAIDVNLAVVLTSGAQLIERIPGIGRWLRFLRAHARRALTENPGLSNMAFFGVVLYVFIPLAATGAITGTLAARLLGLSRLAGLAAVALGSGTICLALACVAYFGKQHSEALGPKLTAVALLIVASAAWLVVRRVRRILRGTAE